MKPITLPVAELKSALTGLGKVLPGRSSLAILNHIQVERTHDGWIALTSTDLDRWATVRLEHPAEGPPAKLLLPFDQLSQLVKSCGKGESLEVMSHGDHHLIRFPLGDTLGESKVPFISPDEFPVPPSIAGEAIPLPSSLRESLLEAMACASEDSTRHVLNGTFIDATDSQANYIVATDGKHLYSANSFTLPLQKSVIIPTHKFLEWKEFGTDGEWQMRLGDQHLQLSSRRWSYITKTLEGHYPDWRAPIPQSVDFKTMIQLDPAKLETLIKLIQRMPCYDDRCHVLGMEWKGGQFMLMGKNHPDEDWLRVPLPDIQGSGPDVTVFLDRDYLIKGLSYGLNTLSLTSALAPLRLHHGGKQLIIMPVRAHATEPTSPRAKPTPAPVISTTVSSQEPQHEVKPPTPPPITTPMPIHPPSIDKSETKSTLEATLVQVEGIKSGLRETLHQLSKIGDAIRASMREQKASEKEIHGVRQTLRSLQGVRI